MGLSLALNNALSGLNVNQQSLSVLSQNIANANTPGYSKQVLNQQAVTIAGNGSGVSVEDVTRKVDIYLTQAVQLQNSTVGQNNTISDYNDRIQLLIGQPGNKNSIDSFTTTFFTNLQSLAQTPQDSTLQQTVVNSGAQLASQIQQLGQGLQNLQFQSDQDIKTAVTNVNNDLQTLSLLNGAIVNGLALGQSAAGLQDQRDTTLKDLASYIDIQTFNRSNGAINITTSGGISLLDDNNYQVSYQPAGSETVFNGGTLSPIQVTRLDPNGNPSGPPVTLVTGGTPGQVASTLTSGKIQGLLAMRDQQIPAIMSQLDTLTSNLRDAVNVIHNQGTGYPGANSYTGDRMVGAQDVNQWSGSIRVAVLDQNGQPVASPYPNQTTGLPPLTLDLTKLNTGFGVGLPTVQGVIDAINQYYGTPQNKAQVGNLDNMQLVSDSVGLPGTPPHLSFDFNLSNLSATGSNVYLTNVKVQDDTGTDITSLTSNVPSIALASTNTYATTVNSPTVTVNTAHPSGLHNGDVVFLSTPTPTSPATTINGIPPSALGGYFTISNVTSTSFQIAANAPAITAGNVTPSTPQTALPPYSSVAAGQSARTNSSAVISSSLSNPSSQYYTVTATVGVDDGSGNVKTSQVTYRINNQQTYALNTSYSAMAVNGQGTLVQPTTHQPVATAILVDANGNELSKVDGRYTTLQKGTLEIKAGKSTYVVAIDSMDSAEHGQPNNIPSNPGTGLGFSGYFGLNNFFQSNQPTLTGDTVAGSALNIQVEQQLIKDPSRLALGSLTATPPSTDPNAAPAYTYERNIGDSSIVGKLSALGAAQVTFAASGGLGTTTQTFTTYAGSIIGATAAQDSLATTNKTNAKTLLDGFTQRASSISGVNLDTELANTVIYQNAYAASARIVTVTNTLFDTLLQSFH